jgi:hypothetical protein
VLRHRAPDANAGGVASSMSAHRGNAGPRAGIACSAPASLVG